MYNTPFDEALRKAFNAAHELYCRECEEETFFNKGALSEATLRGIETDFRNWRDTLSTEDTSTIEE